MEIVREYSQTDVINTGVGMTALDPHENKKLLMLTQEKPRRKRLLERPSRR